MKKDKIALAVGMFLIGFIVGYMVGVWTTLNWVVEKASVYIDIDKETLKILAWKYLNHAYGQWN